jgi:hypothetical protein
VPMSSFACLCITYMWIQKRRGSLTSRIGSKAGTYLFISRCACVRQFWPVPVNPLYRVKTSARLLGLIVHTSRIWIKTRKRHQLPIVQFSEYVSLELLRIGDQANDCADLFVCIKQKYI